MIGVGPAQLDALTAATGRALRRRLDQWMGGTMAGWATSPAEVRSARIEAALAAAGALGLCHEYDLALFLWLHASLGKDAERFLAAPAVREVAGWDAPNRGAVVAELYRLAGADVAPVAGRL